jgi:uncharacterized protein (TIGR02453 family)
MSIRIPKHPQSSRRTAPAKKSPRKSLAPRSTSTASQNSSPSARQPHFSPAAITFLKQLARNNRREWFQPRKQLFTDVLRAPMLALIAGLLDDMVDYAPEFIRAPEKCIMRIYRDTRFSSDKTPYKKNVAAWFAAAGLEKTSGAGFYLSLHQDELHIAAGCYMPDRDQLLRVRRHLLDHHREFRRILNAPALRRHFTQFEGLQLSRAPKGFPPDHPGIDLIRCRQWGVSATLPVSAALKPSLLAEVRRHFRLVAPVVKFLNTPLVADARNKPRQPAAFRLY